MTANILAPPESPPVSGPFRTLLLGAAAGGMAWGIRGQYGHETGAMIAGLLVSLVLCLLLAPHLPSSTLIRTVAWTTVAMGFGGSMTYGQTIGLTQNAGVVGNTDALLWGLLGLGIKGSLWIGFAGTFLGMGLGGIRYRLRDLLPAYAGLLALCALGIWTLNEPHDPARQILPRFYFSADWRWEPGATLKPRREVWGGFLFALIGWLAWVGVVKRDGLAWRLGLWGCLGGAIGFPLGQCLQSFHAWHPELFQTGATARAARLINWWNFMETIFGAVMGAMLAFGLWKNRARIRPAPGAAPELSRATEIPLLLLHLGLLISVEFLSVAWVDTVYDFGLMLGLIPVLGIAGGRLWPWLLAFPITALPIAGKTFRNLVIENGRMGEIPGALLYVVIPIGLAITLAWRWGRPTDTPAQRWLGPALTFSTLLYFLLNYAFFDFPWPWATWTTRTPNALVFIACSALLLFARPSPAPWQRTSGPSTDPPSSS